MAASAIQQEVPPEIRLKERELEYSAQMKAQESEHAERMRALELGQLPAEVYISRIRAVGSIATLVPIAIATAAAAASIMLFEQPLASETVLSTAQQQPKSADYRLMMLSLLWIVAGLVILVTVAMGLWTLQRMGVWSKKLQE